MNIDVTEVRSCLKSFDFATLFREHLGWDKHQGKLTIPINEKTVELTAVAQKRGFAAYVCPSIPDRATRLKVDQQVTKIAREHFVIYADESAGQQVWQWVRREPGKPLASRDHRFDTSQSGDALIARLDRISFSMDEEESATLVEAVGKAKAAFDVDKVTKKFYDRFKEEHTTFRKFIKGLKSQGDLEWYTSIMLNRLMFVYFLQKKPPGFLDGDTNYLQNRLKAVQELKGKDQFLTFYRHFLLRLFHDGLGKAKEDRTFDRDMEKLVGKVPYLNGGFFEVHELEERNKEIGIPDKAFERLFCFFEEFDWHLDERPGRSGRDINPDVVGYIFEKYINQKQMGAYYTKEDITEYISKNTIIPFLFDAAETKCPIAFKSESFLWSLLRDNPDRYIYAAMRYGVIDDQGQVISLPLEIDAGVKNVAKRHGWNKPAEEPFALPSETWREHVARREQCLKVREKLQSGEVHAINDLITLNLDIWQFARDAILNSEGPELLRAFWQAIQKVTVLDPTCGSGAFLFAALRILESLYSDCLERMERFIEDLAGKNHHPEKFSDFRAVLAQIEEHPNEAYFILKCIVINNLFGVDLMEEAVEICRLRLFLKLVAQVESVDQIEPLPDIDFNIRPGNTLVGYVLLSEIRKASESEKSGDKKQKLMLDSDAEDEITRLEEDTRAVEKCFQQFRAQQTIHGGKVNIKDKEELRRRLRELDSKLDRYLGGEYGVTPDKATKFSRWHDSHQPFHWFVEFYGTMQAGGFDVIIGNPPYVELSDVANDYQIKNLSLLSTGNLYSLCLERCSSLSSEHGRLGVITPISAISTPRMSALMKLMTEQFSPLYVSNFAVRPGKLFTGVDMNLSVFVGQRNRAINEKREVYSTTYNRWQEGFRPHLFNTIQYFPATYVAQNSCIPKLGSPNAANLLKSMERFPLLQTFMSSASSSDQVYYHSGGRYFRKCIRQKLSNEYKELSVTKGLGDAVLCLLSSSLYYWYWIVVSDCYHVTKGDVNAMPFPESLGTDKRLHGLATKLLGDLETNARVQVRKRADGSQQKEVNYRVGMSRHILDEIDIVLAEHFGFSDCQLDWLLSFDAKYRGNTSDE